MPLPTKPLRALLTADEGAVGVVTAIVLPVIIILLGLVLDIDYGYATRSRLQTTADAAALAGAIDSAGGITTVRTSAKAIAALNMPTASYGNVVVDSDVQIGNWATATRTFTANGTPLNAVQVTARTATANGNALPTVFARFGGLNSLNVNATATASTLRGNLCFLTLDNTNKTSVQASGTTKVSLLCGLGSNSTSSKAISIGGNASVSAAVVEAVGGVDSSGSSSFGSSTIKTGISSQSDPYANVNPPASNTFPAAPCPSLSLQNTTQNGLKPGQFRAMTGSSAGYSCLGGISLTNANLTLSSGIYVLDGGSLSVGGASSLSCSGCTIILTNRSTSAAATIGTMTMGGSGSGSFIGSSSGPYIGLAIYQDRRAVLGNTDTFTGTTGSTVVGTFYFPRAAMTYTGTSVQTPCFQLIAWDLTFLGTSNVGNTCPTGFGTFGTGTIALVS